MKKIIKKSAFLTAFLPALCFLFSSPQASAQRISKIDGATLAHLCTTQQQFKICDAYLSGLTDSEVWAGKYDEKVTHQVSAEAFCIAPSQTIGQIRGLVGAWLQAHPETAKMPAGKAAYLALHGSYACKAGDVSPAPAAKSE